jgi:hypothetical protein
MEIHLVYGQGIENLGTHQSDVKKLIWKINEPHASGSNFRTVVVLSSAKNAPR